MTSVVVTLHLPPPMGTPLYWSMQGGIFFSAEIRSEGGEIRP